MCDINLRDVDEELVKRVKVKAAGLGISMKAFVIGAIESACDADNTEKALQLLAGALSKPGSGPGIGQFGSRPSAAAQTLNPSSNGHAVNCRCLMCRKSE